MAIELPHQTPLFHSVNRDRYNRQALIRDIEAETGRRLIVYVANMNHQQSAITNEDVAPFHDLVSTLPHDCLVDLMICSPGGDPNAAEMLINMLLSKAIHIRMIIPQAAKSAATMMSLAADEILMGPTSELGPIDPQIPMMTPYGAVWRPAQALLNTLNRIMAEHASGTPLNSAYLPILQGVDAAVIDFCHKAIQHSKDLGKKWLIRSQCKENLPLADQIVSDLCSVDKFPSHGQVINDAQALGLGLNVKSQTDYDIVWQAMFRLYIHYLTEIRDKGLVKIFESNSASVSI